MYMQTLSIPLFNRFQILLDLRVWALCIAFSNQRCVHQCVYVRMPGYAPARVDQTYLGLAYILVQCTYTCLNKFHKQQH